MVADCAGGCGIAFLAYSVVNHWPDHKEEETAGPYVVGHCFVSSRELRAVCVPLLPSGALPAWCRPASRWLPHPHPGLGSVAAH